MALRNLDARINGRLAVLRQRQGDANLLEGTVGLLLSRVTFTQSYDDLLLVEQLVRATRDRIGDVLAVLRSDARLQSALHRFDGAAARWRRTGKAHFAALSQLDIARGQISLEMIPQLVAAAKQHPNLSTYSQLANAYVSRATRTEP